LRSNLVAVAAPPRPPTQYEVSKKQAIGPIQSTDGADTTYVTDVKVEEKVSLERLRA